jgi:hypothetical protein
MTAESSGGFAGVLVSAPEKVALAETSSVLGVGRADRSYTARKHIM